MAIAASAAGLAGQWVESPGTGWIQLSLYHHDTTDEYTLERNLRTIPNGGRAVATSFFLTSAFGIVDGVDAWVQLPYHSIEFTDNSVTPLNRSGLGEVKAFVRFAPLSWLGSSFPFAIRGGVKLPVSDFQLDAQIIPLGEGQRDWELIAEVGHSFWPKSAYVMGWLGYRWREFATDLNRDFGDEVFFLAAVGGNAGALGYKFTVEGWNGGTPLIEGIRLESASREMLHITPTVSYTVGPGALEVGLRTPLAGRNLTGGSAFTAGYFFRVGS